MASSTNANTFQAVKDTDNGWVKLAYGIMIGPNYKHYRDALVNHMAELLAAQNGSTDASSFKGQAEGLVAQNEAGGGSTGAGGQPLSNPHQYRSPTVSDASVGGNDAINPYCAFGLDDDIIHTGWTVGQYKYGVGRCYNEMYETKQQILYLTMGMPKFRNLQTWLKNACNKELAEMNDVGTISLTTKLGTLIKKGIGLAIELPWLPIKWACSIINGVKDYKITEYFYFRDNMPLYYRYVNTLLSEIAVGMGIYGQGVDESVLPEMLKGGPDIFKIMCRRSERLGGGKKYTDDSLTQYTDDILTQMQGDFERIDKTKEPKDGLLAGGLKSFWTGLKTGALEGMNFVGFRIERSENANESFSNSVGNSPLLEQLNSEVAQNRENNLGAAASGTGILASLGKTANKVQNFVNKASDLLNKTKAGNYTGAAAGTIAYIASGNGYFDLPQQWTGSSGCSRNLSFNMKLRAKTGGDNASIYQSIMIPLACIMAAALPRGVGDSTYTSPFIIRAFCKGMFSIPAGIIQSLSISRGAGEFGWSLNRLPTVVDVSFTIADLSPMLFLSIAGGEGMLAAIGQAFANNTKMHEYINTLTGIGAKERYYLMGQLKRRLQAAVLIAKNTTFSATYRGYVMGDSAIIRALMAVTPFTRVPRN